MTGQGPRTTFILERSVGKLSWVGKRSQERAEPLSCVLSSASASAEAAVQRLGQMQSAAACFCSFLKTDGAPLRLAVGVGIWGGCVDPAKVWAQEHKAAQMRPAAQAGRHRWWTFLLLAHVTPQPRRRSRDPHHVTPISTSDWLSAITCRRRGAGRAAAVATATGGGGGQVGRAGVVLLPCTERIPVRLRRCRLRWGSVRSSFQLHRRWAWRCRSAMGDVLAYEAELLGLVREVGVLFCSSPLLKRAGRLPQRSHLGATRWKRALRSGRVLATATDHKGCSMGPKGTDVHGVLGSILPPPPPPKPH